MNPALRKLGFIAGAAALIAASPALANDCQADIELVDANINSANPVPPEDMTAAQRLRDEAAELCAAGDIEAGLAKLSQAKALLGIE